MGRRRLGRVAEAPATARAFYRAERGTYLRVGVAAWRTPPESEAG